ncbi:MAG: M20/M25/M40 family metallo-hydrolase [Candidatus Thorarchaeota archaeon]
MPLDVLQILERLISIDTVSNVSEGKRPTRECPDYINSVLNEAGLDAELIDNDGVYTSLAIHKGKGPKILFLAHFDVVPPGNGWISDPFTLRIDGDRAYGRGTCDDKGNVAALLLLAEKVASSQPECTVMIAATGDEEVGGAKGAAHLRRVLEERGLAPDYVIVADGIHMQVIYRRRNILPTLIRAKRRTSTIRGRRETIRFTTDIFASESRHSAYLRPGVDRHCMLAASKFLDLHPEVVVEAMRGEFVKSNVIPGWVELDVIWPDDTTSELEYDTALTQIFRLLLPISRVAFPTRPSDKGTVICPNLLSLSDDMWTLYCDIRAMTNDSTSVRESIMALLEDWSDLESLEVHAGAGYVDNDPNSSLITAARRALKDLGLPVRLTEGFGASDSRHFAGTGASIFDFGVEGDNLHGPNEWVSISSISKTAEFFHHLIQVLSGGRS